MSTRRSGEERSVALFLDAENLTTGSDQAGLPFDVSLIMDRVREEGQLVFARAYADWTRRGMRDRQRDFQDNVVELAQLPTDMRGKNTADMQLAVDALEMSLLPSAPTVMVIASGDRDFVPLVQKLKRYGRFVIGLGLRGGTSRALATVCQDYIYYDKLAVAEETEYEASLAEAGAAGPPVAARRQEAFGLLREAVQVLKKQGRMPLGSNTRLMMKRLDVDFDPADHGFGSFKDFVLAAQQEKYVRVVGEHGLDMVMDVGEHAAAEAVPSAVVSPEERLELDFSTVEACLESYRKILTYKKVPLLPWEHRRSLVEHLWQRLREADDQGMTIAAMTRELEAFSEERDWNLPVRALQKLTYTLNIGHCFARDGEPQLVRELFNTFLTPAVGFDEALTRMNLTYIKGLKRFREGVKLERQALAQLLFESGEAEYASRVDRLLKQLPRQDQNTG